MLYRVCSVYVTVIGIISCTENGQGKKGVPESNTKRWNGNPDGSPDGSPIISDDGTFDFHETYEVLDSPPPDFSRIIEFLQRTLTLEDAPSETVKGYIADEVDEHFYSLSRTSQNKVIENRPVVPVKEAVDDVEPMNNVLQFDLKRQTLIPRDAEKQLGRQLIVLSPIPSQQMGGGINKLNFLIPSHLVHPTLVMQ